MWEKTATVRAFIHAYCQPVPEQRSTGTVVYRGFFPVDERCALALPPGAREAYGWADGGRRVWLVRAERATISSCEGDVAVTVSADDEAYGEDLTCTARFYEAEPGDTPLAGRRRGVPVAP